MRLAWSSCWGWLALNSTGTGVGVFVVRTGVFFIRLTGRRLVLVLAYSSVGAGAVRGVCAGGVHGGAGGVAIGPRIVLVGAGVVLVCPLYASAVVLVVGASALVLVVLALTRLSPWLALGWCWCVCRTHWCCRWCWRWCLCWRRWRWCWWCWPIRSFL
jgi:hypothetical protein